jgi:hypothetical protein
VALPPAQLTAPEADAIARLPLSHVDGFEPPCPADLGPVEVVALSYPRRADVDLWINLAGCFGEQAADGYIIAG